MLDIKNLMNNWTESQYWELINTYFLYNGNFRLISDMEVFAKDERTMSDQDFSIGIVQVILKFVQRNIIWRSYFEPIKEIAEILFHMFWNIHLIDGHTICHVHSNRGMLVRLCSIVSFRHCIVWFFKDLN